MERGGAVEVRGGTKDAASLSLGWYVFAEGRSYGFLGVTVALMGEECVDVTEAAGGGGVALAPAYGSRRSPPPTLP